MAKYRKKPVVINAVQWTGFNLDEILKFAYKTRRIRFADNLQDLHIETLEGVMTANEGDWIIKGVAGEIYPCKPDIFEQTYESVDPSTK